MEKLCIKNIFFKELEIIKPKNILIMNHLAAEMIRKNNKYIDGLKDFPGTGKDYSRCKLEIGGESVNVYYIVHPSALGRGNRTGLFEDFADFVESKK
jgi:uracil-DNA glycosylase